jgi:ubiquinone/menaquinone biosynthesis C-methylase UbiE
MFLRKRATRRDPLPVAMSGVRSGERLLQIGVGDPRLSGMLAAKVGIGGHAAMVVVDERAAARAQKGAERAAALLDVHVAPLDHLPFDPGSFDVAIVHGLDRLLPALTRDARSALLRDVLRVLRSGGRAVVIEAGEPTGLRALLSSEKRDDEYDGSGGAVAALEAAGFRAARLLADREGYRFSEGIKG